MITPLPPVYTVFSGYIMQAFQEFSKTILPVHGVKDKMGSRSYHLNRTLNHLVVILHGEYSDVGRFGIEAV